MEDRARSLLDGWEGCDSQGCGSAILERVRRGDLKALAAAGEELLGNRSFLLDALSRDVRALDYASDILQADPVVLLAAIARSAYSTQLAPDSFLKDPAFVQQAPRINMIR
mmetsp:Transcript_74566/g.242111  ORF Transcript_74566/g.242111 Transcript_74566/m.242111 type:complete len:111 (-) Transcript_74566:122-454(-)